MKITKKYVLISGGYILDKKSRHKYCSFDGCVKNEIKVCSYQKDKDGFHRLVWVKRSVLKQSNSDEKLFDWWVHEGNTLS